MTRSQISHDRRESIAFAGSRCDSVQAEPHEQQYVQGISPTPTPRIQDDQRGPAGAPLWVAGLALAAGLACSIAWRSMFGSSPDNSQRDSRYQQDPRAERAPRDSIRNLPQSVAATLSQDEAQEAPFPNSLSAMKTLPVESNTTSLEADARAIQSRLADQRSSYDKPADAKVTDLDSASSLSQPQKTQPQKDPSEQKPSYPIQPDQLEESDDEDEGIDLVALAAGAVLPHPDKAETGGEDAFFVSSHGQGAFGVADGVGGWNLEGVDPSRYSRLLMEHAEHAILEGKGDCEDGARDVVGLAHDSISWLGEQEGAVILGSSTICLGLVRPGGLLEMANVGDSGFRVIRGDETVFASESQQHSFNMPFQLACPGPDQYSDTCESATVYELELEPGDVVLLATDGVLDNMWDEQIAHVIHKCLRDGQRSVAKAQECARAIVEAAQENSFNPKFSHSKVAVDDQVVRRL
ncbi:hypothetical protein WJX82_007445 [Trebouxia sp. C0006]